MQKIWKILRAVSEKTALPTNQPTYNNLETFLGISPNQEFFSKIWLSLFYFYSPLTSRKKSEKSFEPFLRKLHYLPTNQPKNKPMLIWRPFSWICPNQEFFPKIRLCDFSTFNSPLASCKKSEKSFKSFLRKLRYQPTNQPTIYYQQHQFYRTWLKSVQQDKITFNHWKIVNLYIAYEFSSSLNNFEFTVN